MTLLGTLASTLLLGAIPTLRSLWDASLVSLLLTVVYLALLVRVQRSIAADAAALERAEKVVPIGGRTNPGAVDEPRVAVLPPVRPAFVLIDAQA